MTVVAPDSPVEDEELVELLIREARRRQRKRRIFVGLTLALTTVSVYIGMKSAASVPRARPLLARHLHVPALAPGGRCPVSSGDMVSNPYFGGMALGHGPVRVLLADAGDIRHGHVLLGNNGIGQWHALQTLWFALPRYQGPFVIRAARLGKPGPIEVQPGRSGNAAGLSPGSGPLVVPAGPTINSYPPPTVKPAWAGYRTVPGSTWVKSPGCYAWQIDGRGFSEIIVVDAVGVYRPPASLSH